MKKVNYIVCLCFIMMGTKTYSQTYTLEQCQRAAIENNRKLQNARLEIEIARQGKQEAFTSFFPKISASGVVFQGFNPILQADMALPEMGVMPLSLMKKGTVASIMAIQPVFAGLQIVYGNKLAGLQKEVSLLQSYLTEKEVRQKTSEYFWQLASLHSKLATLQTVDKQLLEIYRQVEVSVQAGLTTRNDLLRVELRRQEIAGNILSVENGLRISHILLAQHIGVPKDSLKVTSQLLLEPDMPDQYYIAAQEAVLNREEYLLAQKNTEASRYQVRMERGKHLPSVGVGISNVYYNLMDKNVNNGIVFASVSVPISSWWGGSHGIKKAKLKRMQAENDQQEAEDMLIVDIERSWSNLQEAYSQIEIARKSVSSATENLRLNKDYYKVGTSTLTELLDAESLYTESCNNLTSTCAEYQCKLTDYMQKTR